MDSDYPVPTPSKQPATISVESPASPPVTAVQQLQQQLCMKVVTVARGTSSMTQRLCDRNHTYTTFHNTTSVVIHSFVLTTARRYRPAHNRRSQRRSFQAVSHYGSTDNQTYNNFKYSNALGHKPPTRLVVPSGK